MAAYSSITEATHHVREHTDTNLTFYPLDIGVPPEAEIQLRDAMQSAIAELRKQRDIGEFLFSTKTIQLINQFFKDLDRSKKVETWLEHLQQKMDAIDVFLLAFRKIAKKDLKK